ncbi:DUF4839 domain-containing protein [Georgenia yuyongxinii]|nr:DUF4839 domain-containing protein [Georgenia yuyongxinii]
MAGDGSKYELKTVRTIRGTEARVTAKWEKAGWELVTQSQGKLQTEIKFRRAKPRTPWRLLAVLGGVLLLLAVIIFIGVSLSGGGSSQPTTSPTDSAAPPSEQPSGEPEPSEPAEEETLTAENNADLAALLTGPSDGPTVEEFAAKYNGRVIEFDGNIGAMNLHGDASTRYDILVSFGDFSETRSSGGPNFQFRDVNTTHDLHLTGDDIPDTIGVGHNLHIVARVEEFETDSLLFLLDPVSTQFR